MYFQLLKPHSNYVCHKCGTIILTLPDGDILPEVVQCDACGTKNDLTIDCRTGSTHTPTASIASMPASLVRETEKMLKIQEKELSDQREEEERIKKEEEERIKKEEEERIKKQEEERIQKQQEEERIQKQQEEERIKKEEEERIQKQQEEERIKKQEEERIKKEQEAKHKKRDSFQSKFGERPSLIEKRSFSPHVQRRQSDLAPNLYYIWDDFVSSPNLRWIIFGLQNKQLQFYRSGSNGFNELKENLSPKIVNWAVLKVNCEDTQDVKSQIGTPFKAKWQKFTGFTYIGYQFPVLQRGLIIKSKSDMAHLCPNVPFLLEFGSSECPPQELTHELIAERLWSSGDAPSLLDFGDKIITPEKFKSPT